MPVKLRVVHFALSAFLLVALSNGGILTQDNGLPLRGTPHQLLPVINEDSSKTIPLPNHFIEKLQHSSPPESATPIIHHCQRNGCFVIQGTCRSFYRCRMAAGSGVFTISIHHCSHDSVFDDVSAACLSSVSQATTRPECTKTQESFAQSKPDFILKSEGDEKESVARSLEDITLGGSLFRQKRQIPTGEVNHAYSFIGSESSIGVASSFLGSGSFIGGETILDRIENKLVGFKGQMDKTSLSVLESQAATKIFNEITQLITNTRLENVQRHLDKTRKLIENDIFEDHGISIVLQGKVDDESELNKLNLAQVKVTSKEVEDYINQEIDQSKSDILEGYELSSDSRDLSMIEPIVSRLLNLTREYKQRLNHLQSLSVSNQEIEIERSGGYVEYLQFPTLHDTLNDVINEDLAIPSNYSDTTAFAMLDLLVEGLKIHANLLSFTVSANVYTAGKALKDRDLEEFNMRMIRVESAISRVKTSMGTSSTSGGLLNKINLVLDKVEQLPYASIVDDVIKLLKGKRLEVHQVTLDINRLIEVNVIIPEPDTVTKELDFSVSSIPLPVGQWETGTQVSYAIQFVSRNGLSKVSDWSSLYNIQDKAHPIVHIPITETSMTRLVYRRFNQDKPELVAILTDNKINLFRDIEMDLINAVSRANLEGAIQEVRDLIDDGANVSVKFENEMTPLHYAAKYSNSEVMDILISENADVRAKSFDDVEPLHLAAISGVRRVIDDLIIKGADVNAQTEVLGWSPLHFTVANNHASATKALITAGASVNIKDKNGLSPLHLAAGGNEEALQVLLDSDELNINAVTQGGITPLHIAAAAAAGSDDFLVQRILKHKDIDSYSLPEGCPSPVHVASISGNAEALARMIEHGLPTNVVDKDGSTPLHYAVFYGNMKAVLILIQVDQFSKSMLTNDNKTALDVAIAKNREAIVNALQTDIYNLSTVLTDELQDQKNTLEVPTTKCPKEISNNIIISSGQICDRVGDVDSYVNLVKFMIPLEIYYEDQESYSEIFHYYDNDLKAAKNHAKLWRDGDSSIVYGIRQVFDLAKEFEPKFSRSFRINQKYVNNIRTQATQMMEIERIKKEIAQLDADISAFEQMLEMDEGPEIMDYLNATLNVFRNQRDKKHHRLTEDYTITLELRKLAEFLDFVKIDAGRISLYASKTRKTVETFKHNLEQDSTTFERHGTIARKALNQLDEEAIQKNQKLKAAKEKEEELEQQIEEHKQAVTNKMESIQDSRTKLREVKKNLMKKVQRSRWMQIIGAILTPLLIGIPLLIHASHEEKKLTKLLQDTIEGNANQINYLNLQIDRNIQEAKLSRETITNSSSNSVQIRKQMNQLTIINVDLKYLSSDTDTLVKALEKALVGMTIIKDVFDGVKLKLDELIDTATTAGDAASRLNAKYFLYNEISILECNWRDVYFNMENLDECTKNSQILTRLK